MDIPAARLTDTKIEVTIDGRGLAGKESIDVVKEFSVFGEVQLVGNDIIVCSAIQKHGETCHSLGLGIRELKANVESLLGQLL